MEKDKVNCKKCNDTGKYAESIFIYLCDCEIGNQLKNLPTECHSSDW